MTSSCPKNNSRQAAHNLPYLLPQRCHRSGKAQVQSDVQAAHIYAQFQCVGGRHRPELALEQRALDFPPLCGAALRRQGTAGRDGVDGRLQLALEQRARSPAALRGCGKAERQQQWREWKGVGGSVRLAWRRLGWRLGWRLGLCIEHACLVELLCGAGGGRVVA